MFFTKISLFLYNNSDEAGSIVRTRIIHKGSKPVRAPTHRLNPQHNAAQEKGGVGLQGQPVVHQPRTIKIHRAGQRLPHRYRQGLSVLRHRALPQPVLTHRRLR